MSERDGYIPGVPCWVDTSQPDPDKALPFYSGLFGWEFEDAMPEGSEGSYFIGRIRGGDVAAVGRLPRPPGADEVGVRGRKCEGAEARGENRPHQSFVSLLGIQARDDSRGEGSAPARSRCAGPRVTARRAWSFPGTRLAFPLAGGER